MDVQALRELRLLDVLKALGIQENWKERKGGREYFGRCPIHKAEKNHTSFSFDVDGRWHCFSCGQKGKGSVDIVKAIRKIGYQEACEILKEISQSNIPANTRSTPTIELLENPKFQGSYDKFPVQSQWLEDRGLNEETLRHFGVFQYHNPKRTSVYSNKIMIPIKRFKDGELVGYLARSTSVESTTPTPPKYLFPKGLAKHLEVFGSYELRQRLQLDSAKAVLKVAFLVESPFAVMKFHQLGFPAVSPYGWSVSPQQIQILRTLARNWVYLPDLDKRDTAIEQVAPLLSSVCFVKCPEFPGEDPEHLDGEALEALLR